VTEQARCRAEENGMSFIQDMENQHANISGEYLGFQSIYKNSRVKRFRIKVLGWRYVIARRLRGLTRKNLSRNRECEAVFSYRSFGL